MKYDNIVLAVDAVITVDDKVLLIKRNTETFKGKYALPGGKVEKDELLKDSLVREVKEEIGLDVVPFAMLGIYDEVKRDPRGRVVSVVYLCRPVSDFPKEFNASKREVQSVEFIPMRDIVDGKVELAFDHARMIKSYYAISHMGKRM